MKVYCLSLLITLLALTTGAVPALALTVCQETCNTQYYTTVDTLWQAPRPTATAPATYQQQVMVALNTLNQCMAACSAPTPEPTPTLTPEPTPTPEPTSTPPPTRGGGRK